MHQGFASWRWLSGTALAIMLGISTSLHARTIEIQLTGLDLVYNGSSIHDVKSPLGGRGDPAKADPLASATFLVDGAVQGTLTGNIWADVLISGVRGIPVGGGLIASEGNGDTFGFDLHTSADGWGLALNLDTTKIFYSGGAIAIGGGAAASSVTIQELPFNLELDESDAITIAFSSPQLRNVMHDGVFLSHFEASGTGGISGHAAGTSVPVPPIPEPHSAVLLVLGMAALLGWIGHGRTTGLDAA